MWNDYVQALLTALGLSGVSFLIGLAVVRIGERRIERQFGMVGIRDMMARRARLEQALEARKVERAAEIKAIDAEYRMVAQRRMLLERRIAEATAASHAVVRQIGEEAEGMPCFVAMVVNKQVGGVGFQQKPQAYIDRSWAEAQAIEVWCRSAAEARGEVERRYPPAFGYHITRLNEVGSLSGAAGRHKKTT